MNDETLYIQLLSFETAPIKESALEVILNFFPEEYDISMYIEVKADKSLFCGTCKNAVQSSYPFDIKSDFFDGEDLQGIYWGVTLQISLDCIKSFYNQPQMNTHLLGNLYKTCKSSPAEHYGSLFPSNMKGNYLSQDNLGKFTIIHY